MVYISYCIPLINSIEFTNFFTKNTNHYERKNISDEVENESNYLKVTLLKNKNFLITLQEESYTLHYVNSEKCGILRYKYDINVENILEILHIQVYDLIKRFFHKHVSHDEEEDAVLKAWKTSSYSNTNQIIKYYAKQYILKFNIRYNTLMIQSPSTIWSSNQKIIGGFSISKAVELLTNQQERIHKVQIELKYFKYICSNFTDINDKQFYLNEYQNKSSDFLLLYQKYEILNNKLDTKYTTIVNRWQFILTLLGLVLGFYGFKEGLITDDFNKSYNKLYEKNIEIDKKIDINHQILFESNKQLDTFYNINSKEHNNIDKKVIENKSLLINQNEKIDLYYDSSFKQSINIEKKVDENNILITQKVNKDKSIK